MAVQESFTAAAGRSSATEKKAGNGGAVVEAAEKRHGGWMAQMWPEWRSPLQLQAKFVDEVRMIFMQM